MRVTVLHAHSLTGRRQGLLAMGYTYMHTYSNCISLHRMYTLFYIVIILPTLKYKVIRIKIFAVSINCKYCVTFILALWKQVYCIHSLHIITLQNMSQTNN